jgi:hypothetical protein
MWRPIETAPKDGTPIQARIDGYGGDNIIAWSWGLRDSDDQDCGGWEYLTGEPPQCWTDGVCWESNENRERSAQPTHWRVPDHLPLAKDVGRG